jgi:NRAMP (natural resistance-associated macrophage protein)-like metal ion transporter
VRPVKPASVIGVREAALAKHRNPLTRFFSVLGPGIIVGASDDDPSGIATYTVAGASLGFATLWTALVTYPMMATAQYVCAKIGLVTGCGLAGVMRRYYPRAVLYPVVFALLVANTINAGADIGAIAAAVNLILPIRAIALIVPITLSIVGLQLWGSYRLISNVFKWLSLALFAYIGASIFAHPAIVEVLRGTFIPTITLDGTYISTLVAILGTTISPYMFFYQASQEVEEDVSFGRVHLWQRKGTTDNELKYAALDINVGMLFSNVVMYFIILATAATLHASGLAHVASASDAAKALVPFAGKGAEYLLAAGLIGAGFLAVPVLSGSSAYALAETFGWRSGISEKISRAPQFYGVIVASMLVGMQLNFMGINPIAALFWTAVINGVLAPILLGAIMLIANDRKIMGSARTTSSLVNAFGWTTTGAMAVAAVAMFVYWGR